MAQDVMLVSVCVILGGLVAAESALNLSVQAKLHIDLRFTYILVIYCYATKPYTAYAM